MVAPMTSRTPPGRSRSAARKGLARAGASAAATGLSMRVASAEGRDGVLRFTLRRIAGGLYVERDELPRKGPRTCISVEFSNRQAFERWCDDDPSRFDNPLLHQRVRRDGGELWELSG